MNNDDATPKRPMPRRTPCLERADALPMVHLSSTKITGSVCGITFENIYLKESP